MSSHPYTIRFAKQLKCTPFVGVLDKFVHVFFCAVLCCSFSDDMIGGRYRRHSGMSEREEESKRRQTANTKKGIERKISST